MTSSSMLELALTTQRVFSHTCTGAPLAQPLRLGRGLALFRAVSCNRWNRCCCYNPGPIPPIRISARSTINLNARTHTRTHAHARTHTHTHTHTHVNARTHTHTHTRAHTHSLSRVLFPPFFLYFLSLFCLSLLSLSSLSLFSLSLSLSLLLTLCLLSLSLSLPLPSPSSPSLLSAVPLVPSHAHTLQVNDRFDNERGVGGDVLTARLFPPSSRPADDSEACMIDCSSPGRAVHAGISLFLSTPCTPISLSLYTLCSYLSISLHPVPLSLYLSTPCTPRPSTQLSSPHTQPSHPHTQRSHRLHCSTVCV